MQRSAMQVFHFPDIDALAASYDTSDAEYVRFSRASLSAELSQLDLGDFRIRLARFSEPATEVDPAQPIGVLRAAWRHGRAALFVPVGEANASVMNGHCYGTFDALLLAPGGEIHNVTAARHQDWAAVDFEDEAFAALLDASGLSALTDGVRHSVTAWRGAGVAALQRAILQAMRDAARFRHGFVPHMMLPVLRERVMDALLSAFASMASGQDALPRRTREGLRIVNAVDSLLRDRPAQPIYTEGLCAALGVSARKLFDAFAGTYGQSPHQFLKYRRLSLVRRALRTVGPEHASVKWAALSHGFINSGRFAGEYRRLFGEMPSQTLAGGRA